MKLFEKIKMLRESKRLSQNYVAHELNLSQSQYSRREKGEIPFVPDEIIKIAQLFETAVANLFDDIAKEIPVFSSNEIEMERANIWFKLIEQYELRLKEKEEMITFLKQLNERKTNRERFALIINF